MEKKFTHEDYLQLEKEFKKKEKSMEESLWVDSNVGKFDDILRANYNKAVEEFGHVVIEYMAELTNAYQGIFYQVDHEHAFVSAIAAYACDLEKMEQTDFGFGEGIVGQTVVSKKKVVFDELPPITGKNESKEIQLHPKEMIVLPILFNESVYGVMKLVFVRTLEEKFRLLLERTCPNIGAMLESILNNAKMKKLLQNSQAQTEELKAQEEEMRQNLEEMQSTQEELARKNLEIAKSAIEAEGLLKGINVTMATIEFEPNGIIKSANENFLKTVGYSLNEIKGKHHKMFVPQDVLNSGDYASFWERLAAGKSMTGTFKRMDANQKIIWLDAIYNPILDEKGEVIKVIKFAKDVTQQQELMSVSKDMLDGIITVELTPEGIIEEVNGALLDILNYSSNEIKGKHHSIFMTKEEVESESYNTFWDRLRAGKPMNGVVKTLDSKGKTVWFNAIYNPILNNEGKVTKIVKLAKNISDIKTKQLA